MVAGEKRVLVVLEVVVRNKGLLSKSRSADMIVTDRRFIFADRTIAQKGIAAGGDLWANGRSMYGDPDAVAERERSISIPFTEIHRISMLVLGPSCTMSIDHSEGKARDKLNGVLPTPPVRNVVDVSEDVRGDAAVDLAREWVKASTAHFLSMSQKIKEALPTSVVLESEWPREPGVQTD